MSTLTQSERDGLDDVFLSINSCSNNSIKGIFTCFISKRDAFSGRKFLRKAKHSIKKKKFPHLLVFSRKRRKI